MNRARKGRRKPPARNERCDKLERDLDYARRIFDAGHANYALHEALTAMREGDPIPEWVRGGCLEQLSIVTRDPRNQRRWRKEITLAGHFDRHRAVEEARRRGATATGDEQYHVAERIMRDEWRNLHADSHGSIKRSFHYINQIIGRSKGRS